MSFISPILEPRPKVLISSMLDFNIVILTDYFVEAKNEK